MTYEGLDDVKNLETAFTSTSRFTTDNIYSSYNGSKREKEKKKKKKP